MRLALIHQGHHQQLGAVTNAFNLELHKRISALTQRLGCTHPLGFHQAMDRLTQSRPSDADKPPGLHQANTGRLVRRLQQTRKQLRSHLTTDEVAHIAALGDGAVHRGAFCGAEGVIGHGNNNSAAAWGLDGI